MRPTVGATFTVALFLAVVQLCTMFAVFTADWFVFVFWVVVFAFWVAVFAFWVAVFVFWVVVFAFWVAVFVFWATARVAPTISIMP